MRGFSLLVKPASADCNLACDYCFYLDHASLYPETNVHRMSGAVLERIVAGYMATEQEQYGFGWQGGEPTLMGYDFFRRVTDLEQKYGRRGSVVTNGLQTNATLIDDRLARHLAEYRFLVGVSLDGPAELHDGYRRKRGGQPSHADVLAGIRRLEAHRAEFNILVLVNDRNAARAAEVYDYLCENGWLFHQYIPCVEFDEKGALLPYSVSAEAWGDFLCAVFDRWVKSDVGRVSIRLFDSIVARLVEGVGNICHMDDDCRQYFVVEYNGDIYPCDFFVRRDLRLGNVQHDEWEALLRHPDYRRFGERKSQWNPACAECTHIDLCAGDCLKHRFDAIGDPRRLSALCAGWRRFYDHALPGLRRTADGVREERGRRDGTAARRAAPAAGPKVGRNDPCPCGSGKKYKKCCLIR
jgi:uncharacterized protein